MRAVSSPPTARAIDVVEFLAHCNEPPSFSSIVRELDLSQATGHAILGTLTDRGWISRNPRDKTFRLGPGLAELAARAVGARPLAESARRAALQIWREVGHATSVIERTRDALLITAFNGAAGPAGVPSDPIPFTPPFGVGFAAWASGADRDAWIQRGAGGDGALRQRLDDALIRTRARGYDVDWTTPALSHTARLATQLERDDVPSQVGEIIDQLLVECVTNGVLLEEDSTGEPRPVATIAAPVFEHGDDVALLVAVHPLAAMRLEEVEAIGQRLVAATTALGSSD
jgi:DNA-binding IclR family transcriptional regulator